MTSNPLRPQSADAAVHYPTEDVVSPLPPASNKILVIGGPQVGKKFILQRLLQSPSPLSLLPLSLPISPSTAVSLSTLHWPIDTRYYTASLHFHILNDTDIPPFTPSSLSDLLSSPLLSDLQGVMLVYNAGDEQSLHGMKRWGSVISHIDDDDSVMLMVGVEREEGKASDTTWEAATHWAIDHSIEHIRLRFDDAQVQGGQGDEDEEGVRRVRGAFEANHWQYMAMKDRASAARQRLEHSREEDGEEHPLSINARLAQEEEAEEAELEAHLQAEAEMEAQMEEARARWREEGEVKWEGEEEGEEEGVDEEGKTVEERMREDERLESHMAGFEAMFERMQGIRQQAMRAHSTQTQSGTGMEVPTDAERRRRAEDAIMAMLASMGLDDEDEDEEIEIDA